MNSLIKKTNNKSETIELNYNGKKIDMPTMVSNVLNRHFANAGKNVQKQIKKANVDPLRAVKRVEDNLLLGTIMEGEVCKIITSMKNKFSAGLDGIMNAFLKKIVNVIKPVSGLIIS